MEIRAREQWRVERIQKAVGIVCKILDMEDVQLRALIRSLDDVQGHLQVVWNHPMTASQCRAFSTAWQLCGEKPDSVTHHTSGEEHV
jgi:hypothetical protein